MRSFWIASALLWAAPAAATTVYTAGSIGNTDTGYTGLSIRTRVHPGASSAGGTLSVTFQNANTSPVILTSTAQAACLTTGTPTAYDCSSSLFTLTCTGGNSSGGNINLPATVNVTVTCNTATNFPAFTSASTIVVCVDVSSNTVPTSFAAAALGTFLGYNYTSTSTKPCSNTTPGVADTGTTSAYLLGSIVSNAPTGGAVAHNLILKGIGQ